MDVKNVLLKKWLVFKTSFIVLKNDSIRNDSQW